jgi:hypothetical protein
MDKEERAIRLQQLANIVIDAYLGRENSFTPAFADGEEAVLFLCRPDADDDHPELKVNVLYRRSDYDPGEMS